MKVIIFIIMLGFTNCSTLFFKPETRVSPICEWRKEKKERLDKNKQVENGNRKNNKTQEAIIDYPDLDLIEPYPVQEGTKIYKLQEKIQEYAKTLNELIDTEIVSDDIAKLKTSLTDRMDSIHLSLADVYEKQGDKFYTAYNFSKALEAYMDSLDTIREIYNDKVQKSPKEKLDKKIRLTRETGENFLQNKIKTYVDQANYLYLDDQNDNANEAMILAREELYKTLFFNPKTISLYNEQAKIMKLDEFQEGFCNSVFRRGEFDSLKKHVNIKVNLPESYTTKSGIKFTKILTKIGKPIYISEIIRPTETDSWYFTRDYAEKLNNEEKCPDCYQLPEFADIENIKVNKNYEGLWLKSWSPAPIGMTAGNFWFGLYSFDFLHDVIFHPLTWQSYIYPISPDSVHASRGGSWVNDARFIRSADRYALDVVRSSDLGFRLVRPLR
jgi:hypothetical protein